MTTLTVRKALASLIARQLGNSYTRAYDAAEHIMLEDEGATVELRPPIESDLEHAIDSGTLEGVEIEFTVTVDKPGAQFHVALPATCTTPHLIWLLRDTIHCHRIEADLKARGKGGAA
jgi:hypothetical protein